LNDKHDNLQQTNRASPLLPMHKNPTYEKAGRYVACGCSLAVTKKVNMTTYNQLGTNISYEGVKDAIRQRMPIEFVALAHQVNLDNLEIKDLIEKKQAIRIPPLLNKQEIFRILWDMPTNTDSKKWDYIVLLTYLSDGQIEYAPFKTDWYLVRITF